MLLSFIGLGLRDRSGVLPFEQVPGVGCSERRYRRVSALARSIWVYAVTSRLTPIFESLNASVSMMAILTGTATAATGGVVV